MQVCERQRVRELDQRILSFLSLAITLQLNSFFATVGDSWLTLYSSRSSTEDLAVKHKPSLLSASKDTKSHGSLRTTLRRYSTDLISQYSTVYVLTEK